MPNPYGDNRLSGLQPYPNYVREVSMTAGLLCLYGLINLVPGVYDLVLVTTDGQDWSGNSNVYPPVLLHVAALIQVVFSLSAMAVGFQYLVTGASSKMWTMVSAILSLLSIFTIAATVSRMAFETGKATIDFIPVIYGPTDYENNSVATLGIIGFIAYAATNCGALVHFNFKMWSFQSEKWTPFNRAFYRVLLRLFGFFTLLAGVCQLALGAFVYDRVDTEKLSMAVTAGLYNITYSEISMAFSPFQVILGFFMLWRASKSAEGDNNKGKGLVTFQAFAWFVLVFSICAQVLTQSSMQTGTSEDVKAGFSAKIVCLVVGLGLFPIYLDVMHSTIPLALEHGSFSRSAPWKKLMAEEDSKAEATPGAASVATTDAAGSGV